MAGESPSNPLALGPQSVTLNTQAPDATNPSQNYGSTAATGSFGLTGIQGSGVATDGSLTTTQPIQSPDYTNPNISYGSTSGNGSFGLGGIQANPNPDSPVTTTTDTQTSGQQNYVSPGDLPWAIVLMPTTSAGQGGIGQNKHSLQPESWVYGIFLDGDSCQQPLVIGAIPGSGGGSSDGSTGSADGTTTSTDAVGGLPQGKATINQNTQIVYNTLIKGGYTHEQAAGIMGNAQQESGFRTNAHNNIAGGHTGLFQWDATRWARFQKMFPGQTYSAEAQTKYLIWELNGPEAKFVKLLKLKTNDVQAAAIGMANSERFGGWNKGLFHSSGGLNGYSMSNSDLKQRIANARALAAKLGKGSTTTPSTPAASTTTTPTTTTPSTPMMNTNVPTS